MCFVLDVNAFPGMFKTSSANYAEFEPLRQWLENDKRTCLVMGGTKYRTEVGRLKSYLPYLKELETSKKIRIKDIIDSKVDEEEKRIKTLCNDKKFNDQHIVALFCASRCVIFASCDKRADPYVKMQCLYPKKHPRPQIYHTANNASLLREENIVNLQNVK